MELTGDSMEVKPAMTRKLRRRPNDPVPVPEKRRKPTTCQPVFLLDEKEIDNDLRSISRGKLGTPIRKPGKWHAQVDLIYRSIKCLRIHTQVPREWFKVQRFRFHRRRMMLSWSRRESKMENCCTKDGGSTEVNRCTSRAKICPNFQRVYLPLHQKQWVFCLYNSSATFKIT